MNSRLLSAIAILVLALTLSEVGFASSHRGPYSAGGGILPNPPTPGPVSFPQSSPSTPPTSKVVGPLPSFIYSTASDRFLLILRRTNGSVVDVSRAQSRRQTVLSGPEGESLRLDVIPLDGTAVPILDIPVKVGISVAVMVGER